MQMDKNMTNKRFVNLIIISILLVVTAIFSVNLNSESYYFKNKDEVFL